jgi:hypothetical protein
VGKNKAFQSVALGGMIYYAWLERPARDKHSRFLQTFVKYGCKKLFNTWTWLRNAKETFWTETRMDRHFGILA